MNVLAFDTCFDACSVAAGRGLRGLSPSISACHEPMATGHAERLMPMIDEQLAAAGLEMRDLDRIAITLGPGTFTGTRISVAAGRALALALDVPVVAVTSLKLMAMNFAANARGAGELAIATDARRGEVYFERFNPHTLQSLAPAAVLGAAAAAAALSRAGAVVAGSGAAAVAHAAQGLGAQRLRDRAGPSARRPRHVVSCHGNASDARYPSALSACTRRQTAGRRRNRQEWPLTSNVTPFRNLNHISLLWAAPERAGEIAQLHAKLFDQPWDEASIKALLDHPASTSLIAVAGNPQLIKGFIIAQLAADEAEILSVGVSPDWQRSGLGARLLEGLCRASKRGEARRVFLEVAEDNAAARALYAKMGFKETGRRKGYYQRAGSKVDALNLSLDL